MGVGPEQPGLKPDPLTWAGPQWIPDTLSMGSDCSGQMGRFRPWHLQGPTGAVDQAASLSSSTGKGGSVVLHTSLDTNDNA